MIAVWLSAPPSTVAESGDTARIHQRRIRRRQLLGQDHRTFGQALDRGVRRLRQVAHQPRADDADIIDPRRKIGIAHLGEARRDLRDLVHHRALGVDALALDPPLGAAHKARIAEHVEMRVEQIADFFLRRAGQGVGLGLELAQLLGRERDRRREALELGLDLIFVEVIFGDGDVVIGHKNRTDRDAGRDAETFEPPLGLHRSGLVETAGDERGQRVDRALRIGTGGRELDLGARPGRQHHQPHDRSPRHRALSLCHRYFGGELEGEFNEFRGRARVQPAAIANNGFASGRRPLGR